jgi:hypothetical protein
MGDMKRTLEEFYTKKAEQELYEDTGSDLQEDLAAKRYRMLKKGEKLKAKTQKIKDIEKKWHKRSKFGKFAMEGPKQLGKRISKIKSKQAELDRKYKLAIKAK